MNLLSIDTSTDICSVSLFYESQIKTLEKEKVKEHSKYLPIFTKRLISGIENEIKYIALSTGPGSFSGLKIGSSFSKGLANALNIPILPIETFDGIKMNITDIDKYYIAIYSHKNFAFSSLYNNKLKKSKYRCQDINKLDKYTIYGYGFPDNIKIKYITIKPCSEKIGILSLDKFSSFKNKSIDNINPIYLLVEK